ncbi:MAG TPA: pilin [Candidatus Paceibacterota bacterium]|nr:pilin [Candidatus Paceibacterota bacterium]
MSRRIALILILLTLAAVPTAVSAQATTLSGLDIFPIVRCGTSGTPECTPCGFLDILENIIKFLTVGVTGPIAAALFIYAGVLFLFYGANVNMAQRARTVLTNTVYGVLIILLAWLIVVQLIKAIADGSEADRWYEFSCPEFLVRAGRPTPGPAPRPVPEGGGAIFRLPPDNSCDVALLSQRYATNPSVTAESPGIVQLRDCLLRDPVVKAMTDEDQLYSYERNNPLCNLTRGERVCGPCAHSRGSCHYGGGGGSDGAESVDFNAKEGGKITVHYVTESRQIVQNLDDSSCEGNKCSSASGESGLAKELVKAAMEENCQFKWMNFEKDHTHVTAPSCDADGKVLGRTTGIF